MNPRFDLIQSTDRLTLTKGFWVPEHLNFVLVSDFGFRISDFPYGRPH
jgi:hypothetical protein